MLRYQRLSATEDADFALFLQVFRETPSFVYASEGRAPSDDRVKEMMKTLPSGYSSDAVFIHAIYFDDELCGCSFTVRGYPDPGVAYLVLLLITERFQRRGLGVLALRNIEREARRWGCSRIEAVVDSANESALSFWRREGFDVKFTRELKGLVGHAIGIEKNGL